MVLFEILQIVHYNYNNRLVVFHALGWQAPPQVEILVFPPPSVNQKTAHDEDVRVLLPCGSYSFHPGPSNPGIKPNWGFGEFGGKLAPPKGSWAQGEPFAPREHPKT